MDYETLNKVRRAGIVGSILSAVNALIIYDGMRTSVDLIWPSTHEEWGGFYTEGSARASEEMVFPLDACYQCNNMLGSILNNFSQSTRALGAIGHR
ncbi:MAG: hypothetical protein GF309_05385 [Candidatus Lokiarchaeota archaeon]|nr:hypothetical protein [Candidatus Lokiarchaeota archaeon]